MATLRAYPEQLVSEGNGQFEQIRKYTRLHMQHDENNSVLYEKCRTNKRYAE